MDVAWILRARWSFCVVKPSKWLLMKNCTRNYSYTLINCMYRREENNVHAHEISMEHWSDFGFSESTFNILSTRFGIQLHKCIFELDVCSRACVCFFFVAFLLEIHICVFHMAYTFLQRVLRKRPNSETRLAKRQQFIDDTYWPLKMYWKMVFRTFTCVDIFNCTNSLLKMIT